MAKKLTYSRIAAAAGVSIMSVSNVLRHPEQVRKETLEKVHGAIRKLGGTLPELSPITSSGKRQVVTHRPHRRLRFISAGMSRAVQEAPIYNRLFQTLILVAAEMDFDLSFANLSKPIELVDSRFCENTDALLLMGDWSAVSQLPSVPVITLMSSSVSFPHDHVGYNRLAVGEIAAEYLIKKGCQHVAYFGPNHLDRCSSFIQRVRQEKRIKQMKYIIPGPYKISQGSQRIDLSRVAEAVEKLQASGYPLDGVFAHSDQMNIALRDALRDVGIVLDPSCMVGCNNDQQWLDLWGSQAVSVELGVQEMGRLAISRAVELAKAPNSPKMTVLVQPQLALNES